MGLFNLPRVCSISRARGCSWSTPLAFCAALGRGRGTFLPAPRRLRELRASTYLVKQPVSTTGYPVLSFGPQFGGSSDAARRISPRTRSRGPDSVTGRRSTAGLAAGGLVTDQRVDGPEHLALELRRSREQLGVVLSNPTDRSARRWRSRRSSAGTRVTFTTDFPIGYQVAQSTAQLFPLNSPVKFSGVEDLYMYGGQGGDGGGGIHIWNCADCWVNHIEDTWTAGAAIHIDDSFQVEVDNSYFQWMRRTGFYSGRRELWCRPQLVLVGLPDPEQRHHQLQQGRGDALGGWRQRVGLQLCGQRCGFGRAVDGGSARR